MLIIIFVMLVILALAGLVVTYVAFPHRGEAVPNAPWLGEAMTKAVEAAPTIDNTAPDGEAAAPAVPVDEGVHRAS